MTQGDEDFGNGMIDLLEPDHGWSLWKKHDFTNDMKDTALLSTDKPS
jgi:hypothetical protein